MSRLSKDIPTSVLHYYIKMYIAKFKTSKTRTAILLGQATRSWARLKQEDKDIFRTKYNEYLSSHRKRYAKYLKNMEPYLKRKPQKLQSHCDDDEPVVTKQALQDTDATHVSINSESQLDLRQSPEINQSSVNDRMDSQVLRCSYENEGEHGVNNFESQNQCQILPEPVPPQFTNTKEFFTMMQTQDPESSPVSWQSLSNSQKRRYQSAVTLLKKEYIENYMNYLKSLPSIQLFNLLNDAVL